MHFARVVSIFFLLLQLVLLVDFAYSWNESWTSDERPWGKAVIVVSLLMLLGSLAWFIVDIFIFAHGACHLQKFFIASTFALTFLTTGLSVSNWVGEGGGLLPASVVTLYSYWLLFSALTSDPSECNTVSSRSREFAPLIIGLLLTACSVAYASWSVATNTKLFSGSPDQEHENLNSDAATSEQPADKSESSKDVELASAEDDEEDEPVDSANSLEKARLSSRFHLLMACASMYIVMIMSAWGNESTSDGNTDPTLDRANMWIKMASQWACIGIYVWTLVAPVVCANREFN